MKKIYMLTVIFSLFFVPIHSFAAIIPFSASLDGLQEVPPNVTPATGFANILFNDVTNDLSWNITFNGLLSPAIAAHFHLGAIGVDGPVEVPISGISGLSSGSVIGSAVLTSTQEINLLAELLYINIHSAVFPGGEIRGQVEHSTVPEPSTLLLLGSGFMLLAVFRKKIIRE